MAEQYDEYGNPITDGTPQQPAQDDRGDSIRQWYRQYLGRDAGDSEVQSHMGNPNFGNVEATIRGSREAEDYRKRQTAAPPPANSAAAWNREQFRDQWMGTGTDVARQNALLQQYNLTPDGAGRVTLPSGETLDLRYGARAGINQASWTPVAGGGAKYGQAQGYGDGGGSGGGGNGGGSGAGGLGQLDPRIEQLYQTLLGRSQQGLAIDRNDPVIRAQADAYSANEERARRNYLADTAEKSGPYANLQGEARLAAERVGQRTGAFESELMGRELGARRQEIATALSSMQGLLTDQQRMALQRELALLDNALRQQQISLQGQQLGLEGRRLDMQNDQFMRNFGLQEADRASYWDAIRSGLITG